MRITNVRSGRILRMVAACGVLLLLIYSLHKWSNENFVSNNEVLSDSEVGYYKFHRDVYPTLKTGIVMKILFLVQTTRNIYSYDYS